MKRSVPLRSLAFLLVAGGAVVLAVACSVAVGATVDGAHLVFTCIADGADAGCTHADDCCGAACTDHVCQPAFAGCIENNEACSQDSDCCTRTCDAGTCPETSCSVDGFCGIAGSTPCLDDLIPCMDDTECCSSFCDPITATCSPSASATCLAQDSACTKNGDCCSKSCAASTATCGPFVGVPEGGTCGSDGECDLGFYCADHACAACLKNGRACKLDNDCCESVCSHGTCTHS
jgi:hypothetical protein